MRRRLVIGLLVYLLVGVVFGLTTDRQNYMCPAPPASEGWSGAPLPGDITLVEVPRSCLPVLSTGERVRWVAVTTPGWLPLVVRNIAQGAPIAIGSSWLGGR